MPRRWGFSFTTCEPKGIPAIEMTASEAGHDVRDAAQHMARAIRSMEGNIARNQLNNERWQGFYDECLAKCKPLLAKMEQLASEMEELFLALRMLG